MNFPSMVATETAVSYLMSLPCKVGKKLHLYSVSVLWVNRPPLHMGSIGSMFRICAACPWCLDSPGVLFNLSSALIHVLPFRLSSSTSSMGSKCSTGFCPFTSVFTVCSYINRFQGVLQKLHNLRQLLAWWEESGKRGKKILSLWFQNEGVKSVPDRGIRDGKVQKRLLSSPYLHKQWHKWASMKCCEKPQ